jgi:hypothetical protein
LLRIERSAIVYDTRGVVHHQPEEEAVHVPS